MIKPYPVDVLASTVTTPDWKQVCAGAIGSYSYFKLHSVPAGATVYVRFDEGEGKPWGIGNWELVPEKFSRVDVFSTVAGQVVAWVGTPGSLYYDAPRPPVPGGAILVNTAASNLGNGATVTQPAGQSNITPFLSTAFTFRRLHISVRPGQPGPIIVSGNGATSGIWVEPGETITLEAASSAGGNYYFGTYNPHPTDDVQWDYVYEYD